VQAATSRAGRLVGADAGSAAVFTGCAVRHGYIPARRSSGCRRPRRLRPG
jgi:hypothetical protein